MRLKHWLIIPVFMMMAFSLQAQLSSANYKIYSVKEKKEVSIDAIIDDMATHDVLFFGEEHNDSVGHYLEITILQAMFAKYPQQVTLSMEMFDRDVQPVMDEYLRGLIKEKNFVKDARVWSNYSNYRPMVEYAKENHISVVCANAAGRYSGLAVRKGMTGLMQLPDASKKFIAPVPFDTATGKYFDKLVEVMGGHDTSAGAMPVTMPGMDMIMGQSTWDATMAYSIAEYMKSNKGMKVMQVNGRFHSDEGYAVVTQLKHYRPKVKPLIISTGSDDSFPNIDWTQFTGLGDYIIITDPKVKKTFED